MYIRPAKNLTIQFILLQDVPLDSTRKTTQLRRQMLVNLSHIKVLAGGGFLTPLFCQDPPIMLTSPFFKFYPTPSPRCFCCLVCFAESVIVKFTVGLTQMIWLLLAL